MKEKQTIWKLHHKVFQNMMTPENPTTECRHMRIEDSAVYKSQVCGNTTIQQQSNVLFDWQLPFKTCF